ncbi:MAG: hypothetical protein IKR13_02540 [Victivallales bacterium]|nr:hypothetical protein [Victivallales bacterium]
MGTDFKTGFDDAFVETDFLAGVAFDTGLAEAFTTTTLLGAAFVVGLATAFKGKDFFVGTALPEVFAVTFGVVFAGVAGVFFKLFLALLFIQSSPCW